MPTERSRIHTVLDEPVYEAIKQRAESEGVSLSQKARDLLKLAVEIEMDRELDRLVDNRKDNDTSSIPHEEFWADRE